VPDEPSWTVPALAPVTTSVVGVAPFFRAPVKTIDWPLGSKVPVVRISPAERVSVPPDACTRPALMNRSAVVTWPKVPKPASVAPTATVLVLPAEAGPSWKLPPLIVSVPRRLPGGELTPRSTMSWLAPVMVRAGVPTASTWRVPAVALNSREPAKPPAVLIGALV
jgi:hypothetical protein